MGGFGQGVAHGGNRHTPRTNSARVLTAGLARSVRPSAVFSGCRKSCWIGRIRCLPTQLLNPNAFAKPLIVNPMVSVTLQIVINWLVAPVAQLDRASAF